MVLLTLPFLTRGLYESSEGRYANIALTMNQNHDHWIPQLNQQPHMTKPPLTYWLISLGLAIFGNSTFGARIIPALLWILLGCIIVRIGELLENKTFGLISGVVFATTLFTTLGSWALTTDPLVVTFQGMAFWSFLEFQQSKHKKWAFLFWLSLGLALNTKGPVALFPIIFWFVFNRNGAFSILKTHFWPVTLAVGGFWYIGLELKSPGFLWKLIQDELILRSTTDFSGRNPFWWAPIVIYFLPLFLGWLTWFFAFSKKSVKEVSENFPHHWSSLMVLWIFATLFIFSFIQSRLTLYILPLSIPMTLLISYMIRNSNRLILLTTINVALIIVLKSFGTFIYTGDSDAYEIASFVKQRTGNEKVNFLFENSLFGVEFYAGKKFEKFKYDYLILRMMRKTQGENWVVFQKKWQDDFDEIVESQNLIIKKHEAFGKWRLLRVAYPRVELHSSK